MDVDLEDALELSNQNYQLDLEKRKEKYRQARLYQDFELPSPKSTLLLIRKLFFFFVLSI